MKHYYTFLLLIFIIFGLPILSHAALIPIQQKPPTSKIQKKRQFKRLKKQKRKRLKTVQQNREAGSVLLIALAIAWYPISIALLIIALVFSITPLLIVSIILLALPVLALIVLALIFIISLATTNVSLC